MAWLLLLLLVVGAGCFLVGTFTGWRYNLVAAGLFCWILVALIPALQRAL